MSIKINLQENATQLKLHYLPAHINGDGVANVEQYFNNYTRSEHGFLRNALRGYPLYGEELAMPEKYIGVVLQETRKTLNDNDERHLKTSGSFSKFTYWNYDKMPSKGDAYRQTLQWLPLAEELIKPVTAQEIEHELNSHK